jgi:two-component sensor histidine kinase/CHASE1-domain containing sensor protein
MPNPSPSGAPIAIDDALHARVQKSAWFHRYPRGWPFLLFLITSLGTGGSVIAIEHADREARAAELDRNATEIASGLQRRASESVAMLRAASALFSFREITPAQFQQFAGDLYNRGQSRSQFRGALGIGWSPLITPAQVPAVEASVRAGGNPTYTVWPRPIASRKLVVPVIDVMPASPVTQPAIGFDMFSDPIRAEAIDNALRLHQPVASGRLKLLYSDRDKPALGFLIYVPVYRDEADHTKATAMVYSPVRAEAFLDSAAELYRRRGVEIAIYDGDPSPEHLLVQRTVPGRTGVTLDRQIMLANHNWTLRISAKSVQRLTLLSRMTLVFGTLLSLLVMYIARVITRRALEDRQVLEALERQATIRMQLTRELNHRVKNTLANVLSIVSLTRRRASGLDDFAESLTARIRALSATHDLLAQSDWNDAPISEIVRSELAPYLQANEGHIELAGPAINLAPNDALSLGLAIHELATNAAKYGALSTPDGRIAVTWQQMSPEVAELHWREAGGPRVEEPKRRGFGRDLIEKIVAHELRSKVELRFEPEGVQCRLLVPVRRTGAFAIRSDKPANT